MGTLANSEDPDKMQHNAAFYAEEEIKFLMEIIT